MFDFQVTNNFRMGKENFSIFSGVYLQPKLPVVMKASTMTVKSLSAVMLKPQPSSFFTIFFRLQPNYQQMKIKN